MRNWRKRKRRKKNVSVLKPSRKITFQILLYAIESNMHLLEENTRHCQFGITGLERDIYFGVRQS